MKLDIVKYPNKLLFSKSEEICKFDEDLHILLDDMYDTMISSLGIGLAAIQVAKPLKVFIINLLNEDEKQDKNDLIEFINPIITPIGDEMVVYEEGCLSVPNFFEEVNRFKKIKVEYQDRFGNNHSLEADGLLAIAIQHENDHLYGHLFVEKISFLARKKFEKYLKNNKKTKKIK